ncbi:succinylglutamate desuccinylase [Elizabethkingia sp. JS20170427COW]|nr:succinylglutamate desuccinylase [Elizabethkingia sp. JS20170427COW]
MKKDQRVDTLISLDKNNLLEYIPLTVIKGKYPGVTYTIVAGVHGYEYPPIIATQELMKEIDARQLRGNLIILPIANVASFYRRSAFVNPLDNKNLNTAFPGVASGTITDRIAHWITKEVIPNTDVFIDIHGGDANEDLLPFICYYDRQDDKTEKARQLCEASGMEYIVSYPYNILKSEAAKYAFKQAVQDEIVALSIEAGKLGVVQEENVKMIKTAVYRMLNHAGVYKTKNDERNIQKRYFANQSYIKVPVKGIFYSDIKAGEEMIKGQKIGFITDDFGNILQQILAPSDGVVLYKIGTPPVNVGETLMCIGHYN